MRVEKNSKKINQNKFIEKFDFVRNIKMFPYKIVPIKMTPNHDLCNNSH